MERCCTAELSPTCYLAILLWLLILYCNPDVPDDWKGKLNSQNSSVAGMYCIGQRKFVSLQQLVDHYQVYFVTQSSNVFLLHVLALGCMKEWFLAFAISFFSFFQRAPIYTSQKGEKLFLIKPLAKWAKWTSLRVMILTSKLLKVKICTKPHQSLKSYSSRWTLTLVASRVFSQKWHAVTQTM